MRNLFTYYLVSIILPIPLLAYMLYEGSNPLFAIAVLVYAFLYRPLVDGIRLRSLGAVDKKEIVKLFIPFWSMKYFKKLYF